MKKRFFDSATPFADHVKQIIATQEEAPWLTALRQQAIQHYQGLPSRQHEDWKYTNLWPIAEQSFTHIAQKSSLSKEKLSTLVAFSEAYHVVIVDGQYEPLLSDQSVLPEGVTIQPITQVMPAAKEKLTQYQHQEKASLSQLNTALMQTGCHLVVSAGIKLDKPIELVVIHTGNTPALATHMRHIITLEEGASITLIENYIGESDSEASFTHVHSQMTLAKRSQLQHYKIQQEARQAFHLTKTITEQAQESQWQYFELTLGGQLSRSDIQTVLLEPHAKSQLDGLMLLEQEQHADTHMVMSHQAEHTVSNVLFKTVLNDTSHGVFNGKVVVKPQAQKTDSNQYNHNLLLSEGCEIDTKPEMEIYADDVTCGHGSTVGQLDESHLFFLQARGIDKEAAQSILTRGFAMQVLERIAFDNVRDVFSSLIEQRLARVKSS